MWLFFSPDPKFEFLSLEFSNMANAGEAFLWSVNPPRYILIFVTYPLWFDLALNEPVLEAFLCPRLPLKLASAEVAKSNFLPLGDASPDTSVLLWCLLSQIERSPAFIDSFACWFFLPPIKRCILKHMKKSKFQD